MTKYTISKYNDKGEIYAVREWTSEKEAQAVWSELMDGCKKQNKIAHTFDFGDKIIVLISGQKTDQASFERYTYSVENF